MTFLELCNRVRQESGISGSGPITVVNQQAILAKVVEWVRQADLDIQRLQPDWTFLWRIGSAALQEDVRQYSTLDLGLINVNQIKRIAIDGQPLKELSWDVFRNRGFLTAADKQRPTVYTFRPDGVMQVFPVPDAGYTLDVEYSVLPVQMVGDTDVSAIPERFHDVIMHKALMYYASHEEDGSLLQVATMRYDNALAELASACLPRMSFSRGAFLNG